MDNLHPIMRHALASFFRAMKPDEYYLPSDDDSEGWHFAHQQQLEEQEQLEEQQQSDEFGD